MTALVLHRAWTAATAACLAATLGCGSAPSPPARVTEKANAGVAANAPQTLVLPEHVAAISSSHENVPRQPHVSLAAGVEQGGAAAEPSACIRELSAAPTRNPLSLIREPAAPSDLPPAAGPIATESKLADQGSPYMPVEMPAEPATVPREQVPDFPPLTSFADDSLRAPRQEYIGRGELAMQTTPGAQPPRSEPAIQPPPPVSQPQPPRQFAPAAPPEVDRTAMQPVCQRARAISDHAYGLAHRGMLYASRAELIQSLQLVAQALDVQQNTTAHAAALAAGLTALKEARDFAPPPGRLAQPLNVAEITRAHQTPVLKDAEIVSPVIAQQQYLAYAQSQLARAAGNEAVASLTLFRLGKVQTAMAQHESDSQMQHGPQSMVYYQAALTADGRNYLAANELGVLMAHYGQLQEARRLLVQSISIQPHAEAWHNLSVVHQRLGETDLARRASHERELLAQRSPAKSAAEGNVEWVDAKTFAADSPGEAPWADNVVRRSAAGPGRQATQTADRPGLRGSTSFGMAR